MRSLGVLVVAPARRPLLYGLVLAIGVLICALPLYHAYATLQLEWGDVGTIYDMLRNVFERGSLYYYDRGLDYFNVHFCPFLFALAALVVPLDGLPAYLAAHVIALVLAGYALLLLTRKVTASLSTAVLVFFAFLANPHTVATNLYPHYDVFMLMGLLFFYYFWTIGKLPAAVGFLLLALSVKEDAWFYAFWLIMGRATLENVKVTALLLGLSVGYGVLVTGWLWGFLYPGRDDLFMLCYTQAESRSDLLIYFLTHPLATGAKLVTGPGLVFLSSFLFLPLLAPVRSLLALPTLYLWVNSTSPERNSLAFYYSVPSLALFGVALPYGLRNLARGVEWGLTRWGHEAGRARVIARRTPTFAAAALLGAAIAGNVMLPQNLYSSPNLWTVYMDSARRGDGPNGHQEVGWDIIEHRLKPGTSVIADFTLATYVRSRHRTYGFHRDWARLRDGTLRPDYVLYQLRARQPVIGPRRMRAMHEWMLANREYRLIYARDNYFLFERVTGEESRSGATS